MPEQPDNPPTEQPASPAEQPADTAPAQSEDAAPTDAPEADAAPAGDGQPSDAPAAPSPEEPPRPRTYQYGPPPAPPTKRDQRGCLGCVSVVAVAAVALSIFAQMHPERMLQWSMVFRGQWSRPAATKAPTPAEAAKMVEAATLASEDGRRIRVYGQPEDREWFRQWHSQKPIHSPSEIPPIARVANRMTEAASGTLVQVVERDPSHHLVRVHVMDGDCAGRDGWVDEEAVMWPAKVNPRQVGWPDSALAKTK